ncbi:DUF2267 domain-containing protein [Halocatena pleomorpha]|uniref:DUF2267 domain-containing protein n=1 Tax=Halocatena pleomorpha TaxID=1785090 RepID=A0A3P3R7Z3_9EURY|nr:DUF2267 domain-containing protein [Halocatena pleomorpha]RRJ29567.1 DUF2267 domain-containing protein [Halocatena pleomorpha]
MHYDQFMGQVQNRLQLSEGGKAVRSTRAVLTTLGERLQAGEAKDLAGPLPMEVDRYLLEAESGQRFPLNEFFDRVSERANVERSDGVYHAKAIIALLNEIVPANEMQQVKDQLPAGYDPLFELTDREQS